MVISLPKVFSWTRLMKFRLSSLVFFKNFFSTEKMTPLHPSLTFHLIFVSVAAGLNNCIAVTSIKDYSLTNHIYKISSGKSQLTCIVACDQDTKCYSLNYRFPSKTCELSNSTRFADLQDFLFSPDVVYFDHLSRPSGSCVGDAPCKNNGRCFNLAKAPGFKCKCYKDYTGETCNGNKRHTVK